MLDGMDTERMLQFAWLSGLVDGEGCVGLFKQYGRDRNGNRRWASFVPHITIIMTSESACRRAREITGEGRVSVQGRIKNGKQHWVWRCTHKAADRTLKMLLPYLVVKRANAELVLRVCEINSLYHTPGHRHSHGNGRIGRSLEEHTKLELLAAQISELQAWRKDKRPQNLSLNRM
jgi:hypothetical protein